MKRQAVVASQDACVSSQPLLYARKRLCQISE